MRKSLWIFGIALLATTSAQADKKCVQIFYDKAPNIAEKYLFGRLHATMVENLIGHFPEVQQYIIPVETYEADLIERCEANIYLGSFYDNALPAAFLADVKKTSQNVAWIGYNFWQLGKETLRKMWGVEFQGFSSLDWVNLDSNGEPGFFRTIEYLGETFKKYGKYADAEKKNYNAASETAVLKTSKANLVVAWAQHSSRQERIPYIVRNKNRWLVVETPFSYISEEDRYLVFADILFDILAEPPRWEKNPGFIRFEDIHAKVRPWQLDAFHALMQKYELPYGISLISIYADPYMINITDPAEKLIALESNATLGLRSFLSKATKEGASLLMHGVTHQYEDLKNPYNGLSGADYEFWNAATRGPVPLDSVQWVVKRLERGIQSIQLSGFELPALWVTPHYLASTLDYQLFGQLFSWSCGRFEYRLNIKKQTSRLPENLNLNTAGSTQSIKRMGYLQDLKITDIPGAPVNGQFFPYEIYGDAYGARIVPENVGFIQPVLTNMGDKVANVDDLISILKRNRKLRDVWGSLFLHPYLLDTVENGGIAESAGDTAKLEKLLRTIKDLDYEVVDMKVWAKENRDRRPKTFEVE